MRAENEITITQPDDWHLHLRDGLALKDTVAATARCFGRAIVMPNLTPPITTVNEALAYKQRIEDALHNQSDFLPLMVLYLTDNTPVEEIERASHSDAVVACKLYPAGATTNSDSGVTDIQKLYPVLEAMQKYGVKLLVHGEVTTAETDIFDRERVFIENTLAKITQDFPQLKVVLEHITTKDAVDFVLQSNENVAATITPHHLMYNRNHMLVGGIRPHFYCLPVLKRNTHQQALREAATSGNKKFFLGTDSAPHPLSKKETSCGCAGCFSAFAAIELYATVFEEMDSLDKLEGFASHFGPDFYGLPRNSSSITLKKEPWVVPASLPLGDTVVVPVKANETISWKLA
ncbi:MAG: dihydroorotase [Hahellaceae bacterium]|nr:dihydroorotase [Hahellaceae bacterium]MCP5211933.1 dihydroorotase [Hahellaceae bacterium]